MRAHLTTVDPKCDILFVPDGVLGAGEAMRRREFIAFVGCTAAAWPFTAHAQPGKLPTIGFLGTSAASSWSAFTTAFVQRLGELGWIEQRTVAIEYRWGEGRTERFTEIAVEFVKIRADVIVTAGSAVPAVKQVTSVIPIVFAIATDPVGGGLVESLARPGGNVTGVSDQQADLASKRVEVLREAIPGLRRLAILANAGYHDSVIELADVETTARKLGLETIRLEIRRAADVAPAFQALKGQADALYVVSDGLISTNRPRIVTFALAVRLPTMWPAREYLQPGGLLSYGPSFPDLFRRAAEITDKILHGAKPADIPVEQPTKFDFVINLTTATALGLEIPPSLLARADEVIE
jgi:putative tryptophan/tyrosine transport system substrate-binding protein